MPSEQPEILIVDDEEIVREVCGRSLATLQPTCAIAFAENGLKALNLLRKKSFDIVFTDLKMPMMDGVELLDAIKRDFPGTEVIMMTAFATLECAINAMKKGAYDFILKPITPDQIRLAAKKCLEKIELGEENRALRLANEKLRDVQEMKDKFIAITSHELRTPVSHLKGYLDILFNTALNYRLSNQEKKQCINVIFEAVSDLEKIVSSMHDLIHLENGQPRIVSERIDVNLLVQKIVNEFRLLVKQRHQTIEFQKNSDSLKVLADRAQIKGAISEVIRNAIKFTPDGGKVHVQTRSDGAFCVISVKDNGIGIEESELGKVFEKFYEVQDSRYHTSSSEGFLGGGIGLGLPLAQSVALAHGGGIKVLSEKDRGSEFLVYLPLAERASVPNYPLN